MTGDVEEALRDGFHRLALTVADFLPGFVTMLLVIAFAVALAYIVRFALRKVLAGIDFDRRVHRWGLTSSAEWSPRNAPTAIAAHTGFWFVVAAGFLAGLQALNTRTTDALATRALDWIPHLLGAALIFLTGIAVARFLERTVLISAVNMQIAWARFLSIGAKWLTVLFASALTLQHLQVGGALLTLAFTVIFGGIVLALALAIGLGSRDAVSRGWERTFAEEEAKGRAQAASGAGLGEIRHM